MTEAGWVKIQRGVYDRLRDLVIMYAREDVERAMKRDKLRPDGIPTRADQSRMTAAELAITAAMEAVEEAGASEALTDAINLLAKARARVADHVKSV